MVTLLVLLKKYLNHIWLKVSENMSALPVIAYLGGIFIFGLVYWLLDGIRQTLMTVSQTGDTYLFLCMVWGGAVVVYLLFGGIWMIRKYNERQYMEM